MQPRRSGASLLTQVEVKRSISALTAADWLRLHKVARALCREAAFEADDLLQEAFQRALDGTRQCNAHARALSTSWPASCAASPLTGAKPGRRRPEMSLVTETGSLQDVVLQACDNAPAADEALAVNGGSAPKGDHSCPLRR